MIIEAKQKIYVKERADLTFPFKAVRNLSAICTEFLMDIKNPIILGESDVDTKRIPRAIAEIIVILTASEEDCIEICENGESGLKLFKELTNKIMRSHTSVELFTQHEIIFKAISEISNSIVQTEGEDNPLANHDEKK